MAEKSRKKRSGTSKMSDRDSDYGGSEQDTGDPTTFRMLLEKIKVSDKEFVETCQIAGLIARNRKCPTCKSAPVMKLEDSPSAVDSCNWKCKRCKRTYPVRDGTWVEDVCQMRLKDIILILYCWSRNYPEPLCQHEMDLVEGSQVPFIYRRCQKLCLEYFNNAICNIGGNHLIVEIDQFQTATGLHVVGGVEKKNLKKVFFRVLPENWTRDDLCTAIIDNLFGETTVHCHNKTVVDIIAPDGIQYLMRQWKLNLDTSATCESPVVKSLWALYERLIVDDGYTEQSLLQFLYRRRLELFRDPFLQTVDVIAKLHPPKQ